MTNKSPDEDKTKVRVYAFRATRSVKEIIDQAVELTRMDMTEIINEMIALGQEQFWINQEKLLLSRKPKSSGSGGTKHVKKE